MEEKVAATLAAHLGNLTDPRVERTKLHELFDILVIAICAILAGADHWEDIADLDFKAHFKPFM